MKESKLQLIKIAAVLLVFVLITSVVSVVTKKAEGTVFHPSRDAFGVAQGLNKELSREVSFNKDDCDARGYETTLREGFERVLENGKFALYFSKVDGQIALMRLSDGSITYSNPSDEELEGETLLSGTAKERLKAQFELTYYYDNGAGFLNDSYNDSIAYGNMSYKIVGDIFEVTYVLGKNEVTLAEVPQQMSDKRFESFLEKLSSEDAKELKKQYQKATIKGRTDKEIIASYKEKYPNIENNDIYYLKYTSARVLAKVKELLEKAGYTAKDLELDNKENSITPPKSENVRITVVLCYSLHGDGLTVSVDTERLSAPSEIRLNQISILPLFGYGDVQDDGYIVLPDGSGALMYFNNGKNNNSFSMRVYGDDTAISTQSDYQVDEKLSLPIYGIKKNRGAMLTVISQGESMAYVNAATAGTNNCFNNAYASFVIAASDTVSLSQGSELVTAEAQPYDGSFTVDYHILNDDQNDYIGMANYYRDTLIKQGVLKEGNKEFSVIADLIGGVTVQKQIFGITINTTEAVTTFGQMQDIAKVFKEGGINGLSLRIEGWLQGGLSQKYASKIKVLSAVGGKKGLNELLEYCSKEGIPLSAQLYFNNILSNGNGYSKSSMNIRGINGDTAVKYEYDYANRYRRFNNRSIAQLTPAYYGKTADKLLKSLEKYDGLGLTISDIGTELYSDFDKKHYYTRESSKIESEKALEQLTQRQLSVSNPNAYALKGIKTAVDLPLTSSNFTCCDESIPFYQTVLRGCVNYVSPSLNFAKDYKTALLNAVEYGSGIQYTFTGQNTSVLKATDYNYINNGSFEDWRDIALEDAKRVESLLSSIKGEKIVSHERLGDNLYKTGYSSGVSVYVNYSDEDIEVNGINVPAKDFVKEGV